MYVFNIAIHEKKLRNQPHIAKIKSHISIALSFRVLCMDSIYSSIGGTIYWTGNLQGQLVLIRSDQRGFNGDTTASLNNSIVVIPVK